MYKFFAAGMVAVLCVTFTAPAKADFMVIPPWELKKVDGETYACYDFEAAKQLRLVDVDCYEAKNKLKLLEKDLQVTQIDIDKLNKEVAKLSQVIEAQKSLITDLSNERDNYILKYHRARTRDILGGGFLWVVTTGAISLAGGIIIGYYFARR